MDPRAAAFIQQQLSQPVASEQIDPAIKATLEAKLPVILNNATNSPAYRITFLKSPWLRYAAAFIILFGIGALFFLNKSSNHPKSTGAPVVLKKDIAPGKNGAVLTL